MKLNVGFLDSGFNNFGDIWKTCIDLHDEKFGKIIKNYTEFQIKFWLVKQGLNLIVGQIYEKKLQIGIEAWNFQEW